MPDRNDPKSRWSSVREREELQKQRAAEREAAKRARLAREANPEQAVPELETSKRRLTDEERRTIREYRFPSLADRDKTESSKPSAASRSSEPVSGPILPSASSTRSTPGTRWRDSVSPTADASGGGPGLPDLPGDSDGSGGRKRPGNGRLLIFGLALFTVMAVIAYLPFGPLSSDDNPKVPTPSATLPSILESPDGGAITNANGTAVSEPAASAGQPIVCIDPGHGGWDRGWERLDTSDPSYGPPSVTEAELNLGMAYMLKEQLEDNGIFVVMTRSSGASVNMFDQDINEDGETRLNVEDGNNSEQAGDRDELQARINVCNEAGADILISVHINGYSDRSARGYEVLYTAEREFGALNEELATLIYRQMFTSLQQTEMVDTGRGPKPDTESEVVRHDFGTAEHYLLIGPAVEAISITPSTMPGVIVEAAFLSNDADAGWIVQPANQMIVVQAYTQGILEYFDRNPPS